MSSRTILAETRCANWLGDSAHSHCTRPATGWLFAPGQDDPVPGGPICSSCADVVITEYREKIAQVWRYEAAVIQS